MIKDRNFDPCDALLDADEQDIVESFEKGEWKTVDDFKEQAILAQQTAAHSLKKDARVNIRISSHGFYCYLIMALISLTQNFIFASNKEIEENVSDHSIKFSEMITEEYNKIFKSLGENQHHINNIDDSEKLFISGSKLSSLENKPQPVLKDDNKVVF